MGAAFHETIDLLYRCINALDTDGLRRLFVPEVRVVRVGPPLAVMTVDEWLTGLPTIFVEHEELELSRLVEVHDAMAMVTSRFLIRHRATKAPFRIGTNALTLVQAEGSWRIGAAVWMGRAA